MPELPEVETIVKQLKKRIVGKSIISIEILDKKMIDSKIKNITPIKIKNVYRRAKSIIFELNKDYLLVHLRMTGHFHHNPTKEFEQFVVAKFNFADGSLLTHNSIRRFGSIKLVNKEELEQELSKLGVEPLSPDFTLEKFTLLLNGRKRSTLKTLLMDQKFIAGIGNIYAQEALYHAQIGIKKKAGELSDLEVKRLHQEIKRILKLAVKNNGTTVENYVHIEGSGGFQKFLAVYGRQKCPQGHSIRKIYLGGRGTYYCPTCQKC